MSQHLTGCWPNYKLDCCLVYYRVWLWYRDFAVLTLHNLCKCVPVKAMLTLRGQPLNFSLQTSRLHYFVMIEHEIHFFCYLFHEPDELDTQFSVLGL